MGRREAEEMDPGRPSELCRLQDAASGGREDSPRLLGARRAAAGAAGDGGGGGGAASDGAAVVAVKKHQHKHNLRHRYEVLETVGRGTYGKVKKAVERSSRRTVSAALCWWPAAQSLHRTRRTVQRLT